MEKGDFFKVPVAGLEPFEIFEKIITTPELLIERIISTGQTTPAGEWYDQDRDEWVLLLTGEAVLRFEDEKMIALKAGDYLLIPAHSRHRVEFTSSCPPCFWLAIHGQLTITDPDICRE